MNQQRPVLYINILVHDAFEAVKNEVANKVKKLRIPFPESVANFSASRVTWDLSTASKVVDKMGPRLCQEIPIKMAKKGIQVNVENVFSEGNYLVLELQVQHVDAVVMTEAKSKSKTAVQDQDVDTGTLASGWVKGIFTVIGVKNRDSLEREILPAILQRKVSVSIHEMMQEKLVQKKMSADVEIRQEDKQARFFFQTLREVREAVETAKKGLSATAIIQNELTSSEAASTKKSTTAPARPTQANNGSFSKSLTSVVEAATAAVASERANKGQAGTATAKKGPAGTSKPKKSSTTSASEKKGHRRSNSLASAVEAAAASVASTVKRSATVSSAEKGKKGKSDSITSKSSSVSKKVQFLRQSRSED